VPSGDCPAAAVAEIGGVQLVRVGTLAEAVTALESIAAGDAASVPSC
jgi:hypothetical protein